MASVALLGLGAAQPSQAALSSGCAAIQAHWGGSAGVTVSGVAGSDWREGYAVTVGERITYDVTTSGSTNTGATDGAGFALYKNGGLNSPADIVLEQYGRAGNELNLQGTHTVPANDSNYVVYLWTVTDGASATAKVTCQAALPPTVTDGRITISGAGGTGGSYKIGDTVTATWDNTAAGDNNIGITGVTVDFSQFGGGAAVAATNDGSGTWKASYTIAAGAIDSTNRNVSVTATGPGGPITTADTTNATVDNIAPVVTDGRISISGASGTGGAFKIGDTVTATWNNTAGGDNNSDTISSVMVDFTQFGGGAAVPATNSSGTWTATYAIAAGAISTTNRNVTVTATDNAGNATTTSDSTNATVDNIAPLAGNVTSSSANGTYKAGDTVSIQVGFSEAMAVTGTPTLALNSGGTAGYASGSGTSTLTFSYTVLAGQSSADLDYASTAALALSGGTLRDAAGNNAVLTLASPGTAGSLGANKAIVIDGVAPAVTGITSSTANGTYKAGDVVSIQVDFSETMTVTGTPTLALNSGGTAGYASGSGTSTLTFSYTVLAGQNSADLDYASTVALALSGGTLRDAAGNNAVLTLPTPGAANSLGANKAIVIDGVAPTVSSIALVGTPGSSATSVQFLVTFSEAVNNVSTDDFALTVTGNAAGTVASVSAATGTQVTVTVSGISGSGSLRLDVQAGTNIADAAGNALPAFTGGAVHATQAVPGAPTGVSATAAAGQAEVTFTAPGSDGGSAITRYTATSTPGSFTGYCDVPGGSTAGTVCAITVAGLANGTSYTFTVNAKNANGVGPDSAASGAVVPRQVQITTPAGSVPGMAGAATATLSGGGASCTLQASGGFGPAGQVPPQMQASNGQFSFTADHCSGTVTITLQYPEPLPTNVRFRKPNGTGGWFDPQDAATSLGLTLSPDRKTVVYSITDNGRGDADSNLGTIADPLLPVVPLGGGAAAIPTLGEWALALLATLLAALGWWRLPRKLP